MDDTIFWDEDLKDHWWRVIKFLETAGKSGIVFNPKKFQFCSKVEFAGFSNTRVSPLPKYFEVIKLFPTPTNIRAWFGLVNQVAGYGQLRTHMARFRPFLSPKVRFQWTDSMEEAFNEVKQEIVRAIEDGVEIFVPSLETCIRTNWSKQGMGYFLCQKACKCPEVSLTCCSSGWRICLAGSRFNSDAEA